jgi:tripartite-type tricarboxylate transporter receptor subunit TctC
MKLPRRTFLHLAAGAVALPAVSRAARAQAYPTRPVRILVGFPPGGAADIAARLMSQRLSDRLGQPFVIENRPGSGTNVATEAVARAAPDGYTLLVATLSNAINTTLYGNLNFNFIRDTAPVGTIYRVTFVIVANPSIPAKTLSELISYAKANPDKLNLAVSGIGSGAHLAGELFKTMAGINLINVPYTGSPAELTDLFSGQVQVMVDTLSTSIEHIRAGKLRAVAVTTAARSEQLPEVPIVAETVPGYEASGWIGIAAPKTISAEIVDRLNKEINAALAEPMIKARLSELGGAPSPMSPADFGKLIGKETEKWGKVIRTANIKPQ